MNMVPFQKEHLPGVDEGWLDLAISNGPSMTGMDGDKVVFCMGLIIIKEGVAESWIQVPDPFFRTSLPHVRFILSSARKYQDYFIRDLNLRRIAAWIRCDEPRHAAFLEKMGYQREGVMRRFERDGSDCYLYAKVKENGNEC